MRDGLSTPIGLATAHDAEVCQLIGRQLLASAPQRQQAEKECDAGARSDRNGVQLDTPRLVIELDINRWTARGRARRGATLFAALRRPWRLDFRRLCILFLRRRLYVLLLRRRL